MLFRCFAPTPTRNLQTGPQHKSAELSHTQNESFEPQIERKHAPYFTAKYLRLGNQRM